MGRRLLERWLPMAMGTEMNITPAVMTSQKSRAKLTLPVIRPITAENRAIAMASVFRGAKELPSWISVCSGRSVCSPRGRGSVFVLKMVPCC